MTLEPLLQPDVVCPGDPPSPPPPPLPLTAAIYSSTSGSLHGNTAV